MGEKLEGRAGMGTFLDFVEKEQRLASGEGDIGDDQAQPFEDFGRRQVRLKGLACSGLLDEVDFDEALVVLSADLTDDVSLSNLSGTLDEQAFFASACSP